MYATVSCASKQYLVRVSSSPSTLGYGYSRMVIVGAQPSPVNTPGLGNSSWFTYKELDVATNGFSPHNVLDAFWMQIPWQHAKF